MERVAGPESNPFARFAHNERAYILELCARRLTLQQRILLHRVYIRELQLSEVASLFRITPAAATRLHIRAKRAMRNELERRGIAFEDLL